MITLVYAYYNNAQMLERHLAEWSTYPKEVKKSLRAIIVDDCSKIPIKVSTDPGFKIQLYRIKQDIPWNWSGARNLAMSRFEGWALMTDMDHLLTVENAIKMNQLKLHKDVTYRPSRIKRGEPYKRHINSYLIHTKNFWAAGGHDEDFAGHYGSGTPFAKNIAAVSKVKNLSDIALTLVNVDEIADAKTKGLGRFKSKYCAKKVPALLEKRKGPAYRAVNPIRFEWERCL